LNVCIVGAGALGGVIGAYAQAGGCRVHLYSRRGGLLKVSWLGGHAVFEVMGPPWSAPSCDYAVMAVKAYSTASALEAMAAYRVEAPVVVVVQNGLGGLEAVEASLRGRATVAGGVADLGATRRGWLVEQRGEGRLVLGCRGRDCRLELEGLARCLRSGGLPAYAVPDIEPYRWLKLGVNAAINTITALLGVPNGAILESPSLRRLARLIAGLVEAEAERRGVRLPASLWGEVERVARMTAGNISSTLQDLLEGRPSEADYILGPIAHPGSVPEALLLALRGLEELGVRITPKRSRDPSQLG
jgi:2-dehydropantoate 2-reductase